MADLLCDSSVVVELKAVKALDEIHAAQCMNYLKATKLRIGLLVNFGRPRVEVRRIVLDSQEPSSVRINTVFLVS